MEKDPFKIAVVASAHTKNSHADVLVRRWIDPLPTDRDYTWPGPRTRIVSIHALQKGENDLSKEVCAAHGIRECSSISEALTLGGGELAVDAVMVIGEHGEYPENEYGQKLYPRKEMLDEVLAIFDRSHRVAPIFFDKHFSWSIPFAKEMYEGLERRGVPWFGGSSLSLCPAVPTPPDLHGETFQEIVVTTWGPVEAYLFHALEVLEAVVEQRSGGETGIESIRAWKDQSAREAMERGEFSTDLLEAAVCCVGGEALANFPDWRARRDQPMEIFQIHYRDGLKATIVSVKELMRKWAFGCRLANRTDPVAAAMLAGTAELGYPHFARLARHIEDFFLGGQSPVPRTRLYLTSIACAHCMHALAQPGKPLAHSTILLPEERLA